jgi:hypothetical protein
MLRSILAMLGLLAACGPSGPAAPVRSPSQSAAVSAELSPALAPLAWWLGDWDASDGPGGEHWIAAAGAIYGVALHGDRFEVLIVDDGDGPGRPDGVLRLFAMPDGARTAEFRQRRIGDGAATFASTRQSGASSVIDTHPRSSGEPAHWHPACTPRREPRDQEKS